MSSSFRRINVIDKGINIFRIGVVMLHSDFNKNFLFFSFTIDYIRIQSFLPFVQIRNEFLDTALIVECLLYRLFFP